MAFPTALGEFVGEHCGRPIERFPSKPVGLLPERDVEAIVFQAGTDGVDASIPAVVPRATRVLVHEGDVHELQLARVEFFRRYELDHRS